MKYKNKNEEVKEKESEGRKWIKAIEIVVIRVGKMMGKGNELRTDTATKGRKNKQATDQNRL